MTDEDKRYLFHNLDGLPSWQQYSIASRSLLKALDLDDPETTLMVQLTLSELSIATFGLIALVRMFPEFTPIANNLSNKLNEIGQAQGLFRGDTLDTE